MVRTNMVKGAFGKGFDLMKGKWKELLSEGFKVYLLGIVALMVAALIPGALVYLLTASWGAAGMIAAAVVGLFFGWAVYSAVVSVIYNVLDETAAGKGHAIIENAKRNFLPVVAYSICLMILIALVAYVPAGLMVQGGVSYWTAQMFQTFMSLVVSLLVVFAFFELVVMRAGVLQCMWLSARTIKRNFLESILFFIAYAVYSVIAYVVIGLVAVLLIAIPVLVGAPAWASVAGSAAGTVLLAVFGAYAVIVALAMLGALVAAIMPILYYYWKMARES